MRCRNHLMRSTRWGVSRGMLGGVILLLGLASCAGEPAAPQVRLGETVVTGVREANGIEAFLGLPFAAPPVGERRWARPVPWEPDGQSIDATTFAPACMQTSSGVDWYRGMMARVGIDPSLMSAPVYSEDCLYLNVWTDLEAEAPLPVMIYIHGGSNTGGWSYEPNYHGEKLAQQGVIVVTVAYRLGVFGWLSHPDMPIKNPALHDLAESLAWVHEHIAAFGGDPSRITIVGESAGADNAIHLAISPLSQGRVTRLIHQSGGWSFDEDPDTAEAERRGLTLQQLLLGLEGSFAALQAMPAEKILAAVPEVYRGFYFDPVVDPESLPDTLPQLSESGRLPPLEIIIGTNLNEALMYVPEGATPDSYFGSRLSQRTIEAIFAELSPDMPRVDQIDRVGTGIEYLCPSLALASAIDAVGGRAWVYRFDRMRPGFEDIGAYHGAELPYMFDQHDAWLPGNSVEQTITRDMVAHWSAFVRDGDPSTVGAPEWPQWRTEHRHMLRYGEQTSAGAHPDAAFCDRLRDHYLSNTNS